MASIMKSPWLTVSLAIVAMTVGYIFYMQGHGSIAAANSYSCPAQKNQICDSATCKNNGCGIEECGHCPFCKGKTS